MVSFRGNGLKKGKVLRGQKSKEKGRSVCDREDSSCDASFAVINREREQNLEENFSGILRSTTFNDLSKRSGKWKPGEQEAFADKYGGRAEIKWFPFNRNEQGFKEDQNRKIKSQTLPGTLIHFPRRSRVFPIKKKRDGSKEEGGFNGPKPKPTPEKKKRRGGGWGGGGEDMGL